MTSIYTNLATVLAKFPPAVSLVGTGEYEVTSVQVDSVFIPEAMAVVDAMLADRYVVPMSGDVTSGTISPLITMITTDLVICDMIRSRLPKTPDFIEARCDKAMGFLEKIRDGKMDVTSAVGADAGDDSDFEAWSSTQGYHPVFSPVLDPLSQAPDQDRIDADRDDRRGEIADEDC